MNWIMRFIQLYLMQILLYEYYIDNKEMKNIKKKQITYNVTLMIKVQQGLVYIYIYIYIYM